MNGIAVWFVTRRVTTGRKGVCWTRAIRHRRHQHYLMPAGEVEKAILRHDQPGAECDRALITIVATNTLPIPANHPVALCPTSSD
jgi:hypothetical protein